MGGDEELKESFGFENLLDCVATWPVRPSGSVVRQDRKCLFPGKRYLTFNIIPKTTGATQVR